jgi:hypothetical protein
MARFSGNRSRQGRLRIAGVRVPGGRVEGGRIAGLRVPAAGIKGISTAVAAVIALIGRDW